MQDPTFGPLQKVQESIKLEESSNPRPSGMNSSRYPKSKKRCALIVDDDQINLLVVSKYLDSFEMTYQTAVNGKVAIELIESNAKIFKFFDIILMDCDMPVMNGFQATRIIVDMIKKNKIPDVPIVAVTANITTADVETCRSAGMSFYIPKPLHKQPFRDKLESIFNEFESRLEKS